MTTFTFPESPSFRWLSAFSVSVPADLRRPGALRATRTQSVVDLSTGIWAIWMPGFVQFLTDVGAAGGEGGDHGRGCQQDVDDDRGRPSEPAGRHELRQEMDVNRTLVGHGVARGDEKMETLSGETYRQLPFSQSGSATASCFVIASVATDGKEPGSAPLVQLEFIWP
jgi:hypothetical protein